MVKTVYAMRFSCSGVALGQSQQIVTGYSVLVFVIISRRGYRLNSTSAFTRYEDANKRHQSFKTKPTGTRRRFVSSIQLRNDIAVVDGDCLFCAAYCHQMKEVENAQDTSDHDGR